MTDLLKIAGSFVTLWLGTWVLLFALLALAYPLLRRVLFMLHPATASGLLLTALALPCFASLLSTVGLFLPILETGLFNLHDHDHSADCPDHFPFLNAWWLILPVLGLAFGTAGVLILRCVRQLALSRTLMRQLCALSEAKDAQASGLDTGEQGECRVLPDSENLVFTLGWLHNRIFLTSGLLETCSAREVAIILDHEREHARRHDNLRLLLGRLLTLFLPPRLARIWLDDLHLFTEAACDSHTAELHGEIAVAETLLHLQRLIPAQVDRGGQQIACAFTGSEIEGRIRLLLEPRGAAASLRYRPWVSFAAVLLLSIYIVDPLHHIVEWLVELA